MSHTLDNIQVPKTITPWGGIVLWNGLLLVVNWGIWSTLLYPFFDYGYVWAGFITMITLGIVIKQGIIVVSIDDWYGGVVFNRFTKGRRSMFAGFHTKLIWEYVEIPLVPLKREITAKVKKLLPTNDPAETMEIDLLIHMRLDTTGDAKQDAENLINFQSVELHALEDIMLGEVLKMFAAHYSNSDARGEMENLLDARKVQKEVLIDDKVNHDRIHELSKIYGVHIEVVLETSNPDERTKALKETPARAEALRAARQILMKAGEKGEEGLNGDEARRAALLLDKTAEYSEQHFTLEVNAPDLKNLRDINFIPPGALGGGKTKGGDKK